MTPASSGSGPAAIDGDRPSGGERLQRAQAFGPNSHRFSPNDDGTIHTPTVMRRNVAVKEPGPGGVKLTPAASGPVASAPWRSAPQRRSAPRAQGSHPASARLRRRRRHQRAQGPLHQPQRHRRAQGPHLQAHRANSEATPGRRGSISTQVGLRLDNEASREDSDSSTSHQLSVALLVRYGNLRGEMM